MRKLTMGFVVGAVLILTGCRGGPKATLPVFPDARGLQGRGTINTPTVVLFNSRWETSATAGQVRQFYETALAGRPGLTLKGSFPERFTLTDGSMKEIEGEDYWPVDESRPGFAIAVLGAEARTLFALWESLPVKK